MKKTFISLFIPAAILISILGPLALSLKETPFVSDTYGRDYRPFELFAFFCSAFLLIYAALAVKNSQEKGWARLAPPLLFVFAAFVYVTIFSEYSFKSGDYLCYESAAKAIVAGNDAYVGTNYIYPPITAQTLATVYRAISASSSFLGWKTSSQGVWDGVFFIYQCFQYFLILALWQLIFLFAGRLRTEPPIAAVMTTLLLVLNNPLVRTIRHNQTNLWVLDSLLLSFLLVSRNNLLSGLCLSLGIHLKIYPLVFAVYQFFQKQWKAVASALAGFLLILILQIGLFGGWGNWDQFLRFFRTFPRGIFFRDNSLHSLLYNFIRLGSGVFSRPVSYPALMRLSGIATVLAGLLILAWFAGRFYRRSRASPPSEGTSLIAANLCDSLALMLLLSPRVWEHHYVFSLPIIVFAYASGRGRHLTRLALAALLMIGLPTVDIFPLSYHRLFGLFMILFFPRDTDKAPDRPANCSSRCSS